MASLQASFNLISSSSSSSSSCERKFFATLSISKFQTNRLPLPKIQIKTTDKLQTGNTQLGRTTEAVDNQNTVADNALVKLYAIAEEAADRAEMHANIGEQRNNWNILLHNSINAITLTAATVAGLSMIPTGTNSMLAMKLTSTLLYTAATGMLLVVNKIQPSQLAEEQRNAARLFRLLHEQIKTTIAIGKPIMMDVNDAMEKILALDKAYPLPLLPGMLEKFPAVVEPARWWPSQQQRRPQEQRFSVSTSSNGWSQELEEEMRGVLEVLKRKDTAEYVRLSKLVLKVNKILATAGPLLTGLAAMGSALAGSTSFGSWAGLLGVAGGALATVVNTLEHGGQVGMVFEMYRNCAGFYRFLEESIESNLNERDVKNRENGEVFEMKLAIELGRSISELKELAASSSSSSSSQKFGGKLF